MTMKSNLMKALGVAVLATALTASGAFAAVATSTTSVRLSPGGMNVGTLHAGTSVDITDHRGSWCEISKPGRDGWVKCAVLAADRHFDRGGRFDRYDRHDRFDNGPSVNFSFGTGGFGIHANPGWY